ARSPWCAPWSPRGRSRRRGMRPERPSPGHSLLLLPPPAARGALAGGLAARLPRPGRLPGSGPLLLVLVIVVVAAEDGLLGPGEHALGLAGGAALGHVLGELPEVLAALAVEVEAVGGLGEAQVGVHARDDDPCVDGEDLDADEGDPHVGVDDQALVE